MPTPLLKTIGQRLFARRPGPSSPHTEFPTTVAFERELLTGRGAVAWLPSAQPLATLFDAQPLAKLYDAHLLEPLFDKRPRDAAPADPWPAPPGNDEARSGPASELGPDSLPPHNAAAVHDSVMLLKLGRYEVKELLGMGGLSQVHAAWDPVLSRPVAVKTLQLQTDPELQQLLRQHILNEARASAALSHRHIVTVYDAGLSAHGVYIAMEKLRGRDLRQALAQGWRPTPWQAAQLARRVADALAYAHSRGVVHCDIKPANIFLDHRDRPKVLDFGIARVAKDRLHGDGPGLHAGPADERARDEPIMGTPHYLAPEQMRSGKADQRTDIHALGTVLYEVLTGCKAYPGETVDEVIHAVLYSHPEPAHRLRAGVPRKLSAIAAKAMAHDPSQRHASALELSRELRKWCDRQAHLQHRSSTAARAAQVTPSTDRPSHRSLAAGAAVLALLCAGAATWLALTPSPGGTADMPAPQAMPASDPSRG